MLIKEVCQRCNLTKKAVEYYESKGLIRPAILENRYRDYGEQEISVLKEISVLRRCGIGIPEIGEILRSKNKSAALEKYKYAAEVRMQRLAAMSERIDGLIKNYDINSEFEYLSRHDADVCTIKERLIFAFPGNYGLFLSLHFGRFLNEAIDSEEKQRAYIAILQYLDGIELHLSPEIADYLGEFTALTEKDGAAELHAKMSGDMMEAVSDMETYLDQNYEQIKEYLAFKMSDAFKQSSAGQMQRSLLEFQKASGYKTKNLLEFFSELEIF